MNFLFTQDLSAFFIKMEEPYGSAFVNELIKICSKNAEYYEKDNSENGQRMHLGFLGRKKLLCFFISLYHANLLIFLNVSISALKGI